MTGVARPQDQVHDATDGAGTPGSTSDGRPGSSVRFQHQIEDADFASQSQSADGSQQSIVGANVTPEQLKDLTSSLGAARLQGLRVANFAFEPMSLPASRVRFGASFVYVLRGCRSIISARAISLFC
jgi:hypothetical protein